MRTFTKSFFPDMRIGFIPSGTIGTKIETLSELFTEWFLVASDTQNTIEIFIEENGLSEILSAQDFTDLICGNACLSESLMTLIPLLLPFKITEQKIQYLNDHTKALGARVLCPEPTKIYKIAQDILRERAHTRAERIRIYKKERNQRPEIRELERKRHHEYYVTNKPAIIIKHNAYRKANKEKIAAYRKQYNLINRATIAARNTRYYRNNIDAIRTRKKQYYIANREYILEIGRKYRLEHAEQIQTQRHQHYVINKDSILAKNRSYAAEHTEQIAAYQKQYREQNHEKLVAYHTEYRKENADVVSARKKKCYQAKSAEYQAKHHEYYAQNRESVLAQQREKRNQNKQRDNAAKLVCPTYLYLLQMRHDHRADYLKILGQRDLVGFAVKKCPALQEMDAAKCVFCNKNDNPHANCPMQQMAKMPNDITDTMPKFVAIIKNKTLTH